jgi:hypothetical protein
MVSCFGGETPPVWASVIEAVFSEEDLYVGVDHNMSHFLKGAMFAVVADDASTPDDHPEGTFVPPKGDG